MEKKNKILIFAASITAILFWASVFAANRYVLSAYSPTHLVLLRFSIASIVLIIYALFTHIRLPRKQDLLPIMLLGFSGFTIYQIALAYGEQTVPAGPASLLIASNPIFTALLATFFLKERLKKLGWFGILISFSGVALIALRKEDGFQLNLDAILILIAAITLSIYFVFQKPFYKTYNVYEMTTYTILSGTIFMLPFAGGLFKEIANAPVDATMIIAYMGIFPTIIAFLAWNYALKQLPASIATPFLYLSPVVATTIAWIWLGETPSYFALIGGALIIIGVIIVNTKGR